MVPTSVCARRVSSSVQRVQRARSSLGSACARSERRVWQERGCYDVSQSPHTQDTVRNYDRYVHTIIHIYKWMALFRAELLWGDTNAEARDCGITRDRACWARIVNWLAVIVFVYLDCVYFHNNRRLRLGLWFRSVILS